MDQAESFYCVSCNVLHKNDPSAVFFRTGFFRVRYPLGLCRNCRKTLDLQNGGAGEVRPEVSGFEGNGIMKPSFIS
jgi:hypothetical protein